MAVSVYSPAVAFFVAELAANKQEDVGRNVGELLLESRNICDLVRSLQVAGIGPRVPAQARRPVLHAMAGRIQADSPQFVYFAGNKDSYLQLPSVVLNCRQAYTLTMWLKIAPDSPQRGFLLFRCRCPSGGIDAMVTECKDFKWLITLRSYSGSAAEKDETHNLYLTLTPDEWHLVSFHHSSASSILSKSKVSICVDGVYLRSDAAVGNDGEKTRSPKSSDSSTPLQYPFPLQSPVESQWKFFVGFRGRVAGSAFYPDELSLSQAKFLYQLGPTVPHHAFGVCFPQATFDTGHTQLGTLYANMLPLQPTFFWRPHHLQANACLSLVAAGKLNKEHIEMTQTESSRLLIPIVHGDETQVLSDASHLDLWNAVGGVFLGIYLLSDYCVNFEQLSSQTEEIEAVLLLLGNMIQASPDFKEQFLQIHGFHLVSVCLGKLIIPNRKSILESGLVNQCIHLTRALGPDATKGDGIASALQGLLLDFHIWKDCSSETQLYLIESVLGLVSTCSDQIYKSVGVQSLLDILRLYICLSVGDAAVNPVMVSCAQGGGRLLQLAVESAAKASESKSKPFQELEILLMCLDDSSNGILVETVIRVLMVIKISYPAALLKALKSHRFEDTTAMSLLTAKGFPISVRRDALILALWTLSESTRGVDFVKVRDVHALTVERIFLEKKLALTRGPPDARDTEKLMETREQEQAILKPFQRAFVNISMLAECVESAIQCGAWGNSGTFEDLLSVFAHDGPLGTIPSWLILPLLHPLLSQHCTMETCQRVLMSVNVVLKMDEGQSQILGLLGDRAWCRHFFNLACMGESLRLKSSDSGIAETCIELALDALATVLEQKLRLQGFDSNSTWTCVQDCVRVSCAPFGISTELQFLKRCVSLVFQRLARRSDGWNADVISGVVNILALVEGRQLCGTHSSTLQSTDEEQILSFLIDMMASLRKASAGGSLDGMERRALRPAHRILFECMQFVTDDTADRICIEVIAMLQFYSEPWGSPNEKSFREFVVLMFSHLRAATESKLVDENVRGRYFALVYHVMHHFIDLRHNLASRGSVPAHVIPTLDALFDIDTQRDCSKIFEMIAMKFDLTPVPFSSVSGNEWSHPMLDADHIEQVVDPSSQGNEDCEIENGVIGDRKRKEYLAKWLLLRKEIVSRRSTAELTRLAGFQRTLEVSFAASARHWAKLQRKIAEEYLYETQTCEWKLGVSHEGPFPGRRRVVLRPRYKSKFESHPKTDKEQDGEVLDAFVIGRELARAYRGATTDEPPHSGADASEAQDHGDGELPPTEDAASVDGDGVEDGELEQKTTLGAQNGTSNPTDLLGDVKHMDEKHLQGRGTETGPALPGTRKLSSVGVKVTFEARVMLVTASGNTWGSLSFNGKEIYFASVAEHGRQDEKSDSASVNLSSVPKIRRRRWALSTVSAVYLRRYRLRNSALEIFFRRGKHRNVFVDFGHTEEDEKAKNEFARALMTAAPKSAFLQWPSISNFSLVRMHGVQGKWIAGEMSNFDYLMALNTISGRSFNDLCQYPVMPWVISQYSEAQLDLRNPNNYRDLSKPMGALNESRLREFLDRYESFEENGSGDMPPFMYGSHYSTMVGVVLHYLVRIQPFADLHREMQGGHFDVADRLFSSIPRTWSQNTTQLSEVKEITPEWFTTPEIFKNVNRFDLGKTQDGDVVSDVVLPPWARTAEEFIHINREALESDYVSEHLHEWIDLIFGFKQQLPHSEKAHNVFFYLTYANQVDWKKLSKDEAMRSATELQISHFGQTPMQLFNSPHPKRGSSRLFPGPFVPRPMKRCFVRGRHTNATSVDEVVSNKAKTIFFRQPVELVGGSALAISIMEARLVLIYENGAVEVVRYGVPESTKTVLAAAAARSKPKRSTVDILPDLILSADDTASAPIVINEADLMASVSEPMLCFDRELSSSPELATRVPIASNVPKDKLPSVVVITPSGRYALLGGKVDGSVSVRELDHRHGFVRSEGDFRSHRSPVLHIAVDTIPNVLTDAVVSCDASGLVLIWTVSEIRHQIGNIKDIFERESIISRRPQRVFRCRCCPSVCCDISCRMGIVVVCCGVELHLFSIERDERIKTFQAVPAIESLDTSRTIVRVVLCNDGIIVVDVACCDETLVDDGSGVVVDHRLEAYSLAGVFIATRNFESPVSFLSCPSHGDVIFTGHEDGGVGIFRSQTLAEIYLLSPHSSSVPAHPTSWNVARRSDSQSSPVVCIKAGPREDCPAMLVVSTKSGCVFFRPLPDFLRWEKGSSPSSFSQLVNAPLEAVRGTIQQAQNLSSQLRDNAQSIASNAKSLADDAISEFKRFFKR